MVEKMFYTMGEVSEMFDVNQSLIRHWERQFSVLKPKRNKKGNRLFSPQDVEYLKLIYHLVKERGMTLDGARKALRRHRPDDGVPREVELMERLQRIRSLLVEVREELKTGAGEVYTERAEAEPTEPVAAVEKPIEAATPTAPAEPVVAEGADAAPEATNDPSEASADAPDAPVEASQPAKKPRRKKEEEDNHELFAFYEQSLF